MPGKYQIEALFTVSAHVEPQSGYVSGIEDSEFITDYEDQSSWYGESVRIEGGTISFAVEADSEQEARDRAESALDQGYYTGDDLDWEIDGFEINSVEEIEPPMDMEKAVALLKAILDRLVTSGQINAEEQSAILFILDKVVAG